MKTLLIASAVAFAGLAACSPSAPATDGATPAPEAAAPAAAPAASADGPAAGKWKLTTTAMGQAMPPSEVCYEKQMSFEELDKQQKEQQQQSNVTCAEQTYGKDGDAVVSHSVCTADILGKPMTITSDMRAAGDFKSKYTMDMTVKMDPPPMPDMTEQKVQVVAERIGDCDPK